MRNGAEWRGGGGGLQGRGSGRFGPRHFKVYDYFLTLELVIMLIHFIVFQEAVILSAIKSNLFHKFLYEIEATKQKNINCMH